VKVFNSSVEIHVEKRALSCKSLVRIDAYSSLHKFCADRSSENRFGNSQFSIRLFLKTEKSEKKIPERKKLYARDI